MMAKIKKILTDVFSKGNVHIDGVCYVLMSVFPFIASYLSTDEARRMISIKVLFWFGLILGTLNITVVSIKNFRSTAFADSSRNSDGKTPPTEPVKTESTMTKILSVALLISCVTIGANAQSSPPAQAGPSVGQIVDDTAAALKSGAANAWWTAYYIHAPSLPNPNGAGIGVFWVVSQLQSTNISVRVLGGTRIDDVNNSLWMPSGNVTLDMPIKPLAWTGWGWAQGFTVTPIAYAGIGVPLSGATFGNFIIGGKITNNNGDPTAITGLGVAVHLLNIKTGSLDAVYDREKWSGFPGYQDRIGLAFKLKT